MCKYVVAFIIDVLNNLPHLFHFIHETCKGLTVNGYLRKLVKGITKESKSGPGCGEQ